MDASIGWQKMSEICCAVRALGWFNILVLLNGTAILNNSSQIRLGINLFADQRYVWIAWKWSIIPPVTMRCHQACEKGSLPSSEKKPVPALNKIPPRIISTGAHIVISTWDKGNMRRTQNQPIRRYNLSSEIQLSRRDVVQRTIPNKEIAQIQQKPNSPHQLSTPISMSRSQGV